MLNHFALIQAIEQGDYRLARAIIQAWFDDPRTTGYRPLELSYVSLYAMYAGDLEIRDFVLTHAASMPLSPTDGIDYREGAGLIFCHLGVAFLPDRDQALTWLDKALEAVPNFLPAMVEREIIVRGLNRDSLFSCLGETLPRPAWRYDLVAAQMHLPVAAAAPRDTGAPVVGLAIRGKCDANTPALMRVYRRAMPDRPIVVSTWDDTDPAILTALEPICDAIALIRDPENPGYQNRARQISLAQAVLELSSEKCDLTLMTRTDIALFRPGLLDALAALWRRFPGVDGVLQGRLVVSNVFTRRYNSDHPSDMIMFGATADLQRYWASPPHASDEYPGFIEQYLSRNFRVNIGLHPQQFDLTAAQYIAYLRDYFIIRDFSWFEGWWLGRRGALKSAHEQMDYSAVVSQAQWEALVDTSNGELPVNAWAPGMRGALIEALYDRHQVY